MADHDSVCCMCGDIGFADKLFQCSRCRFRFQHLYCSNYNYGNHELLSSSSSNIKSMELCDWCRSESRNSSTSKHQNGSYKRSSSSSSMDHNHHLRNLDIRSEYTSGERMKQHQDDMINNNNNTTTSPGERGTPKNNNNSGVPSPRPSAHRRYKLLKDVMC